MSRSVPGDVLTASPARPLSPRRAAFDLARRFAAFDLARCSFAGRGVPPGTAPASRHEKQIACITTAVYDAPMPTKNPRLTMTLTPTTAAQLRRLSQLTGNSQASLISELLEGQEMVFDRVIQALEAAAMVKEEMKSSLREDLDRSQQVIEAQLGLVLESLDNASAPLLKEAEKIRRRKGRETGGGGQAQRRTPTGSRPRSAAVLDPHLLTGGSK